MNKSNFHNTKAPVQHVKKYKTLEKDLERWQTGTFLLSVENNGPGKKCKEINGSDEGIHR